MALGTGNKARVTLAGGKKLQGNIQKIGQDNFTIADTKNGSTTVAYVHVTRIEKKGFPGWGIAVLAAGIGVGVVLILLSSID
jgi:hypothetical protein